MGHRLAVAVKKTIISQQNVLFTDFQPAEGKTKHYRQPVYFKVCIICEETVSFFAHSFFALPNPLSCSVMNKICLNQETV